DIVPTSKVARVLANLEGMTGVLYPAVFIARLVSLHNGR
ncbi:MAG: two pore domain potassium channel family protein, partial [Microcystis sp. M53600_WE12]|nr:two pore domain potassium channel family protein [Microcystis sp. M53600_WE12]